MFRYAVICVLFIYVNCEEKCNGAHLLEDLGCKPGTVKDNCPQEYTCPDFQLRKNNCNFKSRNYLAGEHVDDDLVYPACNVACFCSNQTDSAQFVCAALDCPEWLGSPLGKDCYRKYDLGKCCSTGQVCPPFDEAKSCKVDGETFKLNQRFSPKDTCLDCVCLEGFKGEYTAPFCQKKICAEELHNAEDLAQNCAPAYYDKTYCCPSNWICPEKGDDIKVVNPKAAESSLRCKYGDKSLKLGEGLNRSYEHWGQVRNIQCECQVPPFLTCYSTDK